MAGTLVAKHGIEKAWWKEAVVYQIYPSSFCDSNDDGVGDLQGVISKVDYLKSLGVDVIWLSPIFKSPQTDMGYDISDYRDVHAPYGSVADVEKLIAELHKRSMKLVLDLVVNHSSDQHPWFVESRSSKSSPKRDWYIWRPARYDSEGKRHPPCNWKAAFEGSVWTWDEATEEYYLHYYDYTQPDLNYENPDVRQAVYDVMRFWLDKGCDGYRMDVIGRISKNLDFPDVPVTDPKQEFQPWPQGDDAFRPRIHEFVQEMNREVISKYDMLSVGEFNYTTVPQMLKFVLPERHEIQMGFTFEHVNLGLLPDNKIALGEWTLPQLKRILADSQSLRDLGAWHAPYLENHDQPRSVSRYANDSPRWRWESAKMLAMMHTTMFGTLFVYQGQEIGMINIPTDWPLEEWKDIRTQNYVKQMTALGQSTDEALKTVQSKARDNARSPMQWSNDRNGGFSTVEPWMRVSEDYEACNVKSQDGVNGSVLEFWKEMLQLRKDMADVFVYGSFELLSEDDPHVFAYIRAGAVLVVLNFAEKAVKYECPRAVDGATLIKSTISGYPGSLAGPTITMEPYSGAIYRI